jgi:hypothetical protein
MTLYDRSPSGVYLQNREVLSSTAGTLVPSSGAEEGQGSWGGGLGGNQVTKSRLQARRRARKTTGFRAKTDF